MSAQTNRQHRSPALLGWTRRSIDAGCRQDFRRYKGELDERHRRYFRDHLGLAGRHPLKARDLAAALPQEASDLLTLIPDSKLHRHHLSGGSSQLLALAILGSAVMADPSLRQLCTAIGLPHSPSPMLPGWSFEADVDPSLLNEEPHVTTIDFLLQHESSVVCVEAKYQEAGLGTCSCGPHRAQVGDCARRVRSRARYWQTAREVFGLPERRDGHYCPISLAYQAIRNVAAARALAANGRKAVFVLLYDDPNPYFRQTGSWPGWPSLLSATLRRAKELDLLTFRAISWQQLIPRLPLSPNVHVWLEEKHGLVCSSSTPMTPNEETADQPAPTAPARRAGLPPSG